jgi:hypothetical protein
MSISLMTAIFEVEFFDLKDENENVTKASTAKLVLLAMADHANDEGEGSYPSIERLCKKTALSAQTIRNTFDALRFNGIISLEGKSKYNTNNHTINTKSFPRAIGKETTYLTLYPLDPLMSTVAPLTGEVSSTYSLDPNHNTIKESSAKLLKTDEVKGKYKTKATLPAGSGLDWQIATGASSAEIAASQDVSAREQAVANFYESAMGYNPLPWWSDKDLARLLRFLLDKPAAEVTAFAEWSKAKFSSFKPSKALQYPLKVPTTNAARTMAGEERI